MPASHKHETFDNESHDIRSKIDSRQTVRTHRKGSDHSKLKHEVFSDAPKPPPVKRKHSHVRFDVKVTEKQTWQHDDIDSSNYYTKYGESSHDKKTKKSADNKSTIQTIYSWWSKPPKPSVLFDSSDLMKNVEKESKNEKDNKKTV